MISEEEWVEVYGARVHNLQNVDVTFPRNKLVVIKFPDTFFLCPLIFKCLKN